MGKKNRKKTRQKLNFERQSYLTDVPDEQFLAAMAIVYGCMPRLHLTVPEERLRAYLNAIIYLSTVYTPWAKVHNFKAIRRLYYRLKAKGVLGSLRYALKSPVPLNIRRPVRKDAGTLPLTPRRRKCPECPVCRQDAMVCYGTHWQGAVLVRNYRCSACGASALWISTDNHQWWKTPRRYAKKYPTCA